VSAPLLTGAEFVLDTREARSRFGAAAMKSLSEGEPLYLTGPLGTGKTTLLQQLLGGRVGLRSEVLGWPGRWTTVVQCYCIAADRPAQIKRSMRRMFGEQHARTLMSACAYTRARRRFDIVKHPEPTGRACRDAGTLLIDSLRTWRARLTSDEVGGRRQSVAATRDRGRMQVCVLHHHRKATSENKRPSKLADVYGSVWLMAGAAPRCAMGRSWRSGGRVAALEGTGGGVGPLEFATRPPARRIPSPGPAGRLDRYSCEPVRKASRRTARRRLSTARRPEQRRGREGSAGGSGEARRRGLRRGASARGGRATRPLSVHRGNVTHDNA